MSQPIKIAVWFSMAIGMAHANAGATSPTTPGGDSPGSTNELVTPVLPTRPGVAPCVFASPSETYKYVESDPTLLLGSDSAEQKISLDPKTVEQLIKTGIQELQALQKEKVKGNYDSYAKALGFSSADEAAKVQTGKSLRVYRVPLDKLVHYQKSSKSADLFVNESLTVLVPVLVDCKIRSSFVISELDAGKELRIVGRGPSNFLKDRTPESLSTIDGVVKIPELRLQFLARKLQSSVILIPIAHYPLFRFEKDKEYAAPEIFARLQPVAKKVAEAFADGDEDEIIERSSRSKQSQQN